jgi:SAM-dependent methyltransferase
MSAPAYDRIGLSYSEVRRADPRLQAAIWRALGNAKSVLNIGAGAGSYEPSDREVIAVEPSPVMIAQRPPNAAPAIEGVAESLPLEDESVDATMAIFTIQHWNDLDRGLTEVLRVTRERIVLLTLDVDVTASMWLCRDYLPEIIEYERKMFPPIEHLHAVLPGLQVQTIPVPADCIDGFCIAHWARPEAYLDPLVRQATSTWHLLPAPVADRGLDRLRRDLQSGEWDRRNGQLRTRRALDVGLRLVTAELH